MLAPDKLYEIVPSCLSHGKLRIEQEYYNQIGQSAGAFSAGSAVCIYGELLNAVRGNIVSSKWYAEKIGGYDPGSLIGSSEIVIETNGSYDIGFQFQPPSGGWFPGVYRVKVYFDNALQADHVFLMR